MNDKWHYVSFWVKGDIDKMRKEFFKGRLPQNMLIDALSIEEEKDSKLKRIKR